jgi:hypothetical protein
VAVPVTRSFARTSGTLVPITVKPANDRSSAFLGRRQHGVCDVDVVAASADVAGEGVDDFVLARARV